MTGSLIDDLLEPVAERGISGHQSEAAEAQAKEDEVEHSDPPYPNDGRQMAQPA